MKTTTILLSLFLAYGAAPAAAQIREVSVPARPGLLGLTQTRAAASSLGDLRAGSRLPDDVELRLWRGYGLTGTTGVVLRRTAGRWTGYTTRVVQCDVSVPGTLGDTLPPETMRRYAEIAKRDCGKPLPAMQSPTVIFKVDTVAVRPLPPGAYLQQAWDDAAAFGVASLPPSPPVERLMLDGTVLVAELRTGNDYRASEFTLIRPAPSDADRRVQRMFDAVYRRLGLGGLLTEEER